MTTDKPAQSTALKAKVQRYWNNTPCGVKNTPCEQGSQEFYEEIQKYRYSMEPHIPRVAEFDRHAGNRVLEVGCGLGTDGQQFARGEARYFGCDLSIRSVELARRGFDVFELPGAFMCTDAENLPFRRGTFDVAYSNGVLHHSPDTDRAIREVHRVLARDGKAIIMLYARSFTFLASAHVLGRIRLERTRRRMGHEAFNRFVGLPLEHAGWLPEWVVINNSTDGVGNPHSKLYSAAQVRRAFSDFRSVRLEKHFFPRNKLPIIGSWMPARLAYLLGRVMGCFWIIKAIK